MIIYGRVNARLRGNGYFRGVPARIPPGSKKGQPKPLKRYLDAKFPARLKQAMRTAKFVTPDGGLDVPRLSREAKCTRAVLHKYLGGTSKTIEALLLFRIAEVLDVSPAWLLKGEGDPARPHALNHEQRRSLEALLKTPLTR